MKRPKSAGGWHSIRYSIKMARKVGPVAFVKALLSKNACKTCALGMGGQRGGMRNELGHFPEVCKKSMQAMAADMGGKIDAEFYASYNIAQLQSLSPRELEGLGRIATPLILEPGAQHYRPLSWEQALDITVGKLRQVDPLRSFFYFSGRSSNEAGFLLQTFCRILGTNHVNNCSYYCHQASGVGLTEALGSGTATVTLEDVESSDCFFLIGGNPSSNHPRLMSSLMRLRRRGGQVVVINPVLEPGLVNFSIPSDPRSLLFGSKIASYYLQPKIGGDIALLLGIAKYVLADGKAVDTSFINQFTEGFAEFEQVVANTCWDDIVKASGLRRDQIEQVAAVYSQARSVIFSWTMGITHHSHGVQGVQTIVNLALMRGMVGRPGAGLLPIRGHSNVQGIGSMGVTPELKKELLANLHTIGVDVPQAKGYDTMACMEAAHEGQMDFALCLGGNLYGSNPDSDFAQAAFQKIDTVVYMNTTLNQGHMYGTGKTTLILPVLARDEEHQATTQESMFNYVRLSEGGPARVPGLKSEVEIISSIAAQVLPEHPVLDWNALMDHDAIRRLIGKIIPGYSMASTIGTTKTEFHISNRTFHEPHFPTEGGKARFHAHGIPQTPRLAQDQLMMMSIRSEGQFNTVVYEEEDVFRGIERRDVVLMNELDMEARGLKCDDRVTVSSDIGQMKGLRARPYPVARGNAAMYYPEVNRIIPRRLDPKSRTPAYKAVPVTVSKTP